MQSVSAPAFGVSLRELLPDAQFVGAADIRATSCCADSRACREGDLFAALPGTMVDGRDFAIAAMARGARAILTESPAPNVPLPMCIVPDAREAYGRICHALVGHPSERLKAIGITGTNGKTTTTYLAAAVLEAAGWPCGVIGTLGYFDGIDVGRTSLTTPDAAELAHLLARSEVNGCTHVALEASSHALAQRRLSGTHLDVVAVTNICRDHFDYHGDREAYWLAKARILEYLSPEGIAIFNIDDPGARELAASFQGPALSVAIDDAAEITATPAEQFLSEQTFLLSMGDVTVPVRTPLIGRHNIYNCLVAAAIGEVYGADPAAIVRGLESVTDIPGRLERVECGQPFGVFVDYAHTPDALQQVLGALRPLTRRRLICVFGAGGNRDREKRALMGRVVDQQADLLVITTDNPRHEDPAVIADDVQSGCAHRAQCHVELDRGRAIAWALEQAREGDCVLIAGKGHETCQQIEDEEVYFDDRECARAWLYANAPGRSLLRAA